MKLTVTIEGEFSLTAKKDLDVHLEIDGPTPITAEQARIMCGALELVKNKLRADARPHAST